MEVKLVLENVRFKKRNAGQDPGIYLQLFEYIVKSGSSERKLIDLDQIIYIPFPAILPAELVCALSELPPAKILEFYEEILSLVPMPNEDSYAIVRGRKEIILSASSYADREVEASKHHVKGRRKVKFYHKCKSCRNDLLGDALEQLAPIITLNCNHDFHRNCAEELNYRCPSCDFALFKEVIEFEENCFLYKEVIGDAIACNDASTGTRLKRHYEPKEGFFEFALTGDLAAVQVASFEMMPESCLEICYGVSKDGRTALHYAAAGGSEKVCKFLLEELKIDINLKDMEVGEAPLHLAIFEEHFETSAFLLEHGADPNVRNNMGRTPLHYAAEYGPVELIQLLISKGVEVNAFADCGTALRHAAAVGQKDFVKALLDNHADPNVTSPDHLSPLVASVCSQSVECVKLLLQAGADVNIRGPKGMTPLAYAALEGSAEIIKCMLDVGADPNFTNDFGWTPVEEAALRGRCWAAKILFPLTSRVPTILEWSIDGLFKQVKSVKSWQQRMRREKVLFLRSKSKGAECFKRDDYLGAVQWYTEALGHIPFDVDVLLQRSQCWAMMNMGALAFEDAESCTQRKPYWPKAHLRKGSALLLLKKPEQAVDAFRRGCDLDPEDKELEELERSLREAIKTELGHVIP